MTPRASTGWDKVKGDDATVLLGLAAMARMRNSIGDDRVDGMMPSDVQRRRPRSSYGGEVRKRTQGEGMNEKRRPRGLRPATALDVARDPSACTKHDLIRPGSRPTHPSRPRPDPFATYTAPIPDEAPRRLSIDGIKHRNAARTLTAGFRSQTYLLRYAPEGCQRGTHGLRTHAHTNTHTQTQTHTHMARHAPYPL